VQIGCSRTHQPFDRAFADGQEGSQLPRGAADGRPAPPLLDYLQNTDVSAISRHKKLKLRK